MIATQDQLESLCLKWFSDIGYEVAFGPGLTRSRPSIAGSGPRGLSGNILSEISYTFSDSLVGI